jgi:hypothetical protein
VIAGTKRSADTVEVQAGWNLIGPVSAPVRAASIVTVPGGLASSPLYGYDGGFRREDTLRPGRGYWIRMQQPGALIIAAGQAPGAAGRLAISMEPAAPPPPPGEGVEDANSALLPLRTALLPNYPNPFNPSTELRFDLSSAGEVRLDVFNALGERVGTLVDGHREAGRHSVTWDAAGFASGAYFARMTAGPATEMMRMVLVR